MIEEQLMQRATEEVAARRVYADWLEERGDARAELIRLEERRREVTPLDDAYWLVKPRITELREGCDEAWLARFDYDLRYRPVFKDWSRADTRGLFRLIREFLERWTRVPMSDAQPSPAAHAWAALARETPLRDGVPERLLERIDTPPFVLLLQQAEGDVRWCIDDANAEDPCVQTFVLDFDSNAWVPSEMQGLYDHAKMTVTSFALSYLLSYARGSTGSYGATLAKTAAIWSQLDTWASCITHLDDTTIYEGLDVLVVASPTDDSNQRALKVLVNRPVTVEQLPAFLATPPDHGSRSGDFISPAELGALLDFTL